VNQQQNNQGGQGGQQGWSGRRSAAWSAKPEARTGRPAKVVDSRAAENKVAVSGSASLTPTKKVLTLEAPLRRGLFVPGSNGKPCVIGKRGAKIPAGACLPPRLMRNGMSSVKVPATNR
jgi:hypothetical protein